MSRIKIAVEVVPASHDLPTSAVAVKLREAVQRRADDGWTLRTTTRRGGSFYCVFARKEKRGG